MVKQIFTSTIEDQGKHLDVFLLEQMDTTRSQTQKLIRRDRVMVNGEVTSKARLKMKKGDKVEIVEVAEVVTSVKEDESLMDDVVVVGETKDYLVVEKPAGLLTHPTLAEEKVSLEAWVLKNYPKLKGVGEYKNRPGIVHRLDRDTSGLLVIAKNQKMFDHLKSQFQNREIEKYYWALVYGKISLDHEIIEFPIDRGPEGRMVARPKMGQITLKNVKTIQSGKKSLTEFWPEKEYINYTLLKVRLHSGRTHQVRVHMFAYGHPVVGDTLYYNKKNKVKLNRLFLHSFKLGFKDLSGESHVFESELPKKLQDFLDNVK